jgi:uncharacterized tellurite resistance protein B-like protein
MLKAIRSFFEDNITHETNTTLDTDRRQLATAALLIEVASADHSLDDAELEHIKTLLRQKFQLDETQLAALTELAHAEKDEATSLYQFTQLINEHCTPEDKFKLIAAMWEVAFADNDLDKYEEHLIRRVADLIYVSHSDFIRAKLSVQN